MRREENGAVGSKEQGDNLGDDRGSALQQVLEILQVYDRRLNNLESLLAEMCRAISCPKRDKEWYNTAELAELFRKSDFTVREKWCNQGRITCEKDPDSGKWRIPSDEVRRLQNGGSLLPRQPR